MIDLSHPIQAGMTVYPGDPAVELADALTVEHDGVRVTEIGMGSHVGTHLDAPSHTVAGGRNLDQISLTELCGEALVLRVDAVARQPLGVHELRLNELDAVPDIVAIHTGWDKRFGTPEYFSHPYLTRDAALRLCELGMKVLAVDTLNPDRTPEQGEDDSAAFHVHEVVLGSDRLIIENLRGLELVSDRVRLGFFPLPLHATDGAPVRAVAFA